MDTHNVGRGRKSIIDALKSIQAKALVISIKTDILFPIQEQEFLVAHIPNAELTIINSHYGHDGFLLEHEKITFPEPVISLAIEPKTKSDQEKLGLALKRLTEEDPTFQFYGHQFHLTNILFLLDNTYIQY